MCTHTPIHSTGVKIRRQSQVSVLTFNLVLDSISLLFTIVCARVAKLSVLRDIPISAPHLTGEIL